MAALGEDLLNIVNKLQDLVFNTIGNDSLDLPQIVGYSCVIRRQARTLTCATLPGRRGITIIWKVVCPRKHRWPRLPTQRKRNRHTETFDPTTYQHTKRTDRQTGER